MAAQLPAHSFSDTAPFTILFPASGVNFFTSIELNNESSVTLVAQVGNRPYFVPPQGSGTYRLDGTERQLIVTPQATPKTTGVLFSSLNSVDDPLPISLARGSSIPGGGLAGVPVDPLLLTNINVVVIGVEVGGDTVDRYQMLADGRQFWGDGANPQDCELHRFDIDVMQFENSLNVIGKVAANAVGAARGAGILTGAVTYADNDNHTWESDGNGGLLFRNRWNTIGASFRFIGGQGGFEMGQLSDPNTNANGETALLINQYGVGLKRVLVGAVDSGGVGYRMLRMVN